MSYPENKLENNRKAQRIASDTLDVLREMIVPGMCEKDIAELVSMMMTGKGSGPFWYHGLAALVLLGERSVMSLSARDYVPDDSTGLKDRDILTVDCSPTFGGEWGDYARTFFIEEGRAVREKEVSDPEFRKGLDAELELHRFLVEELNPSLTYEEVYLALNRRIEELGFVNLDFHGNLGHSIEDDEKERICLETGNRTVIKEYGKPFTLEPHICIPGGSFGYKRENIYYIEGDRIREL